MSSDISPAAVLGTLAAGALIKHLGAAYTAKKDFVYVGKVSELYVWPVKSCGGLKVQSGQCESTGLFHGGVGDRYVYVNVYLFTCDLVHFHVIKRFDRIHIYM